jgi:hypothetical protein
MPNTRKFEVAPIGAAQTSEVIALYKKFSKIDLSDKIAELCQELDGIAEYKIKMALSIYKGTVARKKKAIHPMFFINTAKKLARQIKNEARQKDEEFIIPIKIGKVI